MTKNLKKKLTLRMYEYIKTIYNLQDKKKSVDKTHDRKMVGIY